MRASLRWLLAMTALASAVALAWPDTVSRAVARSEASIVDSQASINSAVAPATVSAVAAASVPALPAQLPTHTLEPAEFDPFVGEQAPPSPPPKPVAPVAPIPQPAPTPIAPPLDYRYLGQMIDPSGKRLVFLGKAEREVLVAVGAQLEEGYMVDAIAPDGIQLRYPPLDLRAVIPIPPARDTFAP